MRQQRIPHILIAILAVGVAASLGASPLLQKKEKKQEEKKDQEQPPAANKDARPDASKGGKNEQPAPLFGGQATLKSSRQSKDSQTMGFNGLDPEGKVQKAALDAPITGGDTMNAQALIAFKPEKQELAQFIAEGHLKVAAPPSTEKAEAKTDNKSDKDKEKDKDKKEKKK